MDRRLRHQVTKYEGILGTKFVSDTGGLSFTEVYFHPKRAPQLMIDNNKCMAILIQRDTYEIIGTDL